jgi:hypothetical protein
MRSPLGSVLALAALVWGGGVAFGGCGLDINGLGAATDAGGDSTTDGASLGDSGLGGETASGSCTDGVQNGAETGVDCGGPVCPSRCPTGVGCKGGSDCQSMVCTTATLQCAAPTCTDGAKNGMETDVDCGGPTCLPCGNQKGCVSGTDCVSTLCSMMECVPPSCADHMKDGNETDVDCGGPDCAPCVTGQTCAVMRDCAGGDYCDPTMKCATQDTLGTACSRDAACSSGNCVDGVCCDTPATTCDGCMACNLTGSIGTCSNVPLGSDPHAVCAADVATCEAATCQGAGTCTLANGTSCGQSTCSSDRQTTYACSGASCVSTTATCAPFACAGPACGGSCADDTQCADGNYCNASGDCVVQKVLGSTCNEAADCKSSPCAECAGSGGCVDGYCCNTACNAGCQSCSMSGGAAQNGQCGNARMGSAGSPSCAPYVCNGTGALCPTGCASDNECATADYCDENGHCQPTKASGASCNTGAGSDCKVSGCRECGTLMCNGGGHCS